ncbi:hypothetical protein ZWY2020_037805 [Hordeum vulgare]|nr:hypothetical protein ZWY2020_037805 [Hordeum vulgare]
MVDPFEEEATRTPVQEPRVDGHSTHETPVQDQPRVEVPSAHETPVPEATSQQTPATHALADVERSGWGAWPDRTEVPDWTEVPDCNEVPDWTEGSGGCSVDGGDEFMDSESNVQVDGDTVYKRGSTCLQVVPATHEHRPVIKPEGDRGWAHPRGVRKPNSILGVLCRTNFPRFVTLSGEGQVCND